MNWHEFVFSERKSHRLTRHLLFWLVWGPYFFMSMNILPKQTAAPPNSGYSIWNFSEMIHGLLILCIHLLACYMFIYFILPRYLLMGKYFLLLLSTVLLGFVMIQANRFVDIVVIPFLKGSGDLSPIPYYTSVFSGLISAIRIIAIASAIKLVKHWWLKQKEKERLEKEKVDTELQLLKSQIHPGFLFNSLNNIHSFSLAASPKAPEMLLKLSEILSYMLYDCGDNEVPLEKDIRILKDYSALEKMRYGDKLEMNFDVKGDIQHDKIAPLLLLHFIAGSFRQSDDRMTEQPWINLEIEIENHVLHMKLINGKSTVITQNKDEDDNLMQAKRRLELMYPDNYELTLIEEPEIMIINLKINLLLNVAGRNVVLQHKKELIEGIA